MENKNLPPKYFSLNNGIQIPSLGCGTSTYQFPYENLTECILQAIKIGYRHIDTAHYYDNYHQLKPALSEAFKNLKREDFFVVTKIYSNNQTTAIEDLKIGLEKIGLKYFDLVLIHWSYGPHPTHEFWKSLEECVRLGYAHSIGLSNFNVQTIHDLLTYAKIKPVCNQIEYHVYLQQDKLVKYCLSQKIQVVAFTPLSKAGLKSVNNQSINPFNDETLIKISQKYKRTVAQLILCWMLTKNIIPIPKSTKIKNIEENFNCYFEIDEKDIQTINSLNQNIRIADFYDLFD